MVSNDPRCQSEGSSTKERNHLDSKDIKLEGEILPGYKSTWTEIKRSKRKGSSGREPDHLKMYFKPYYLQTNNFVVP